MKKKLLKGSFVFIMVSVLVIFLLPTFVFALPSDEPEIEVIEVSPIFECWIDNGDDTYTLVFGYENRSTFAGEPADVEIPKGDKNKLSGGLAEWNGLLPTEFVYPNVVEGRPGRTNWGIAEPNAFVITNYTPIMGNIVWTLDGRTATGNASNANQECVPEEPTPPPSPAPAAVVEVEAAVDEPEVEVLAEVEQPSRTKALTVWQVNCLENNQLEFIFVYPYKDNNWLTIYDMGGNEVYREDISYSNPRTVVELPDGMYTVKTFKSEGRIIQEFTIGLPCDAAAPVAVKDVAELPYTGFNYLPYSIAAAILAGLAGVMIAFRKRVFKTAKK